MSPIHRSTTFFGLGSRLLLAAAFALVIALSRHPARRWPRRRPGRSSGTTHGSAGPTRTRRSSPGTRSAASTSNTSRSGRPIRRSAASPDPRRPSWATRLRRHGPRAADRLAGHRLRRRAVRPAVDGAAEQRRVHHPGGGERPGLHLFGRERRERARHPVRVQGGRLRPAGVPAGLDGAGAQHRLVADRRGRRALHRLQRRPAARLRRGGLRAPTCAPLWTGNLKTSGQAAPAVANGLVYATSSERLVAFRAGGCGQRDLPAGLGERAGRRVGHRLRAHPGRRDRPSRRQGVLRQRRLPKPGRETSTIYATPPAAAPPPETSTARPCGSRTRPTSTRSRPT